MKSNSIIPGVVDGRVSAFPNEDGDISVHIVIGKIGSSDETGDRVELIITRENAGRIGEAMMAGRSNGVPCSVGVALQRTLV
ncbi:hypothetical protein ACH4SP_06190 [Streptomyces sp. NPDC021093]|uniref:hypothetical protein n=1 Tax=Streptomyces sp. NPDC021093 TaxID=3365112 RepID=UPI00379339A9